MDRVLFPVPVPCSVSITYNVFPIWSVSGSTYKALFGQNGLSYGAVMNSPKIFAA